MELERGGSEVEADWEERVEDAEKDGKVEEKEEEVEEEGGDANQVIRPLPCCLSLWKSPL